MITEKQALKKVDELYEACHGTLMKKVKSLIRSGAIELSDYSNDFELPRILLAASVEVFDDFALFSKESQRIIQNLKHF